MAQTAWGHTGQLSSYTEPQPEPAPGAEHPDGAAVLSPCPPRQSLVLGSCLRWGGHGGGAGSWWGSWGLSEEPAQKGGESKASRSLMGKTKRKGESCSKTEAEQFHEGLIQRARAVTENSA